MRVDTEGTRTGSQDQPGVSGESELGKLSADEAQGAHSDTDNAPKAVAGDPGRSPNASTADKDQAETTAAIQALLDDGYVLVLESLMAANLVEYEHDVNNKPAPRTLGFLARVEGMRSVKATLAQRDVLTRGCQCSAAFPTT